jgi:cytochrome c oxidase accessory protein FixG
MCPYARFQSVMFDKDTMIVSYDAGRGEPRGTRKKGVDPQAEGLGDCVDCSLCVQVCPTGIDIRDGLQYECISCGLCIDACDAVMEKMHYPKRLISFTTEHALNHGKTSILRPRLVGYALVLTAMISLFLYTVATRVPLDVGVIRDRTMLYREADDGLVENIYTLKIANMDNAAHTFAVTVRGEYDFQFIGDDRVEVKGGEVYSDLVRLKLDPGFLQEPNSDIYFKVQAIDNPALTSEQVSRFIGPSVRRRP